MTDHKPACGEELKKDLCEAGCFNPDCSCNDFKRKNSMDILIQLLTDPENQPHQYVGDSKGLRTALTADRPAPEPNCKRCDDRGHWYGGVDGHIEYPCDCTKSPERGGETTETLATLKNGHNHLRILWNFARNTGEKLGHDYKGVLNRMKKEIERLEKLPLVDLCDYCGHEGHHTVDCDGYAPKRPTTSEATPDAEKEFIKQYGDGNPPDYVTSTPEHEGSKAELEAAIEFFENQSQLWNPHIKPLLQAARAHAKQAGGDDEAKGVIETLDRENDDLRRQLKLAQYNFEWYFTRFMAATGKTTAECEAEWEKKNPILYGYPQANQQAAGDVEALEAFRQIANVYMIATHKMHDDISSTAKHKVDLVFAALAHRPLAGTEVEKLKRGEPAVFNDESDYQKGWQRGLQRGWNDCIDHLNSIGMLRGKN
jgi:hypothetical protein